MWTRWGAKRLLRNSWETISVFVKQWSVTRIHTCQLSRFSRESPSFSSNLPVSRLSHQISRELPIVAFFHFFFSTNFVIFAISKKKIKQEVDLVLLFSAFIWSENLNKRRQSNLYIFNEYCNWSEINQSYCTIHSTINVVFAHCLHLICRSKGGQRGFRFTSKGILRRPSLGFWGGEKPCFAESGEDYSSSWRPAICKHTR